MMQQNTPWLLPLLALTLALFGLVMLFLTRPSKNARAVNLDRRFKRAFGEEVLETDDKANSSLLENIGSRIIRSSSSVDNEVKLLLSQAGWKRKSDIAIFYGLQALLPIIVLLLASYSLFSDGLGQKDWGMLFIIGCAAYMLPKRILAHLASNRQARIAEQTPIMVHLLRVLLGTGLSIEQALRSLATDTTILLPDMAAELHHLLRRVEAGEDLALAMTDTARQLDVASLTDLARILEQTWRMGGSVMRSLTELSELIEARTQTDLKEKVSKLSAKMTVVMMLFLFPALLVFLAAPGFLAILQGLKNAMG